MMSHEDTYEKRDANASTLLAIGAGLIVLILLLMFIVLGIMKMFQSQTQAVQTPSASALAEKNPVPPKPRLQVDAVADLAVIRATEDSLLQGFGWIDREAGIARIPIDSAMQLVVREQPAHRAEPGREKEGVQK